MNTILLCSKQFTETYKNNWQKVYYKISKMALITIALCFLPYICSAQITYTFTGGSLTNSNWSNDSNWSVNGKPGTTINSGETVVINYFSNAEPTGDLPGCFIDVDLTFAAGSALIVNADKTLILAGVNSARTLINRGTLTNNGAITGMSGILDNFGTIQNYGSIGYADAFDSVLALPTLSLSLNNKTGAIIHNHELAVSVANIGYTDASQSGGLGLTLNFKNSGTVNNNGSVIVESVTLENSGTWNNANSFCVLQLNGGQITNSGTMTNLGFVQPGGSVVTSLPELLLVNSGSIINNATFVISSTNTANPNSKSEFLASSNFTNSTGADFTIKGILENSGVLNNNGVLENQGTLRNLAAGQISNSASSTFTSIANTLVENGGNFIADGTFTNFGRLENSGGSLAIGGTLTNKNVLDVISGTVLNKVGGVFTNDLTATISGTFTNVGAINQKGIVTVYGTLTNSGFLDNQKTITNRGAFSNSGEITNAAIGLIETLGTGSFTNTGMIKGSGRLTAPTFTNAVTGAISPGINASSKITFATPFINEGALSLEISGAGVAGATSGYDQLVVENQPITLGGTLNVSFAANTAYRPSIGSSFTLINAQSITAGSRFANVVLPDISPNIWQVVYDEAAGDVRLIVPCSPPVVAQQPASQTVNAGQIVTFSANVSLANTYQWYESTNGGTVFLKISGATNSTYSIKASPGNNLNRYRVVATNTACGLSVTSDQATLTVNTTNPAFGLVISEFRLRGTSNASQFDEYVEIANTTNAAITVDSPDGWALAALDATGNASSIVGIIAANTVIPAKGRYLFTNTTTNGYSLNAMAAGDASFAADITDDSGIALFSTGNSANFDETTRIDVVGFQKSGTLANLFREGTGLAPVSSSAVSYAWVRRMANGVPQDTDDNAADFVLVASSLDNSSINGVFSQLGAPGVENLSSPREHNQGFSSTLFDATVSSTIAPNQVRDTLEVTNGAAGTLVLRRSFTNNTGAPVTKLRLRFVSITNAQDGGADGSEADLRLLNSSTSTINGKTVSGLTLETPPTQPDGGGLNSTMLVEGVSAVTPLAVGATIHVEIKFGVMARGKYRFVANFESAP